MVTTKDTLSIEQLRLLDEHLRLVIDLNSELNLTRIVDWDQGQILHIEDSIAAADIFNAM